MKASKRKDIFVSHYWETLDGEDALKTFPKTEPYVKTKVHSLTEEEVTGRKSEVFNTKEGEMQPGSDDNYVKITGDQIGSALGGDRSSRKKVL